MKKRRVMILMAVILCGIFAAQDSRAQFTTVTGTVTDPNGIPYSYGIMSAILVPALSGAWQLNGQPYSGRVGPATLDSTGTFKVNFGSNALITPASSQWQITINSNPGGIPPPFGTGSQAFVVTMTISGASQDISVTLNSLAPKLTNFFSTTAGGSPTQLQYNLAGALAGILGSSVTAGTGEITLTASSDTATPLTILPNSGTQTGPLIQVTTTNIGASNAIVEKWTNLASGDRYTNNFGNHVHGDTVVGIGTDLIIWGAGNWEYSSNNNPAYWFARPFAGGVNTGIQFEINAAKLLTYGNNLLPVGGNGIASTVGADNHTVEITGNYAPVTLMASTYATGFYIVTIYVEVSTGVATATITTSIGYADDTGAQAPSGASLNAAVTGTIQTLSFPIRFVTGTALTYSTSTANSPRYKIFARVQAI